MKTWLAAICLLLFSQTGESQSLINQIKNGVNTVTGNNSGSNLSNDEVVKGLKEALNVGTNNATGKASRMDGFYKNSLIKIPFPPEAKVVESTARNLGMSSQVDKFVMTMNRAAEEASKEAAPIFINAVKTMTITDGITILRGGDGAATNYLKGRTQNDLTVKFSPIVKRAINKVQLTKYWKPIVTKYNKIPGVKKQNPDLDKYVTGKALEGLFKLIAEEENKIRKDPAARVSEILRKVFG
ncbi:MAG: DUF4197 domain-containing protein [Bacteroidetes bacterium]|nr:DUF4197 domain-containing protein [Bacteroidota bacterium]